ncbi:MAG: glutaredoxin 3 [Candidatus Abyssubacteria bacterium]|nr:glutaredoxin 3 [Candidatus Abyssubacteria bacterium]
MKHVTIYSGPNCPYCNMAKALLRKKGVEFEEINVELDPDAMMQVIKKTGRRTIPQIFIDDFHVGGCDDLYAYEELGKLDSLLGLDE